MKRKKRLRADPAKVRAWEERSREKAREKQRQASGSGPLSDSTPRAKGPGPDGRRKGTTKLCAREGCGVEFYVPPSRLSRKFCSPACADIAGRVSPPESRERQGRSQHQNGSKKGPRNPMYKYGKRTGVKGGARFKSGMTSCARCGSGALLQEHHVVYVQHLRQEGGDVTDSANALTLCADCHRKHHDRAHPVPLALLRDENYRFAAALYGPKSYDYLRRRYSGEDPRLDALLETA